MATRPSDLLSGIPSVSELLDKPPVRALADRWNRSVVASGVRSFLDELKSDLQRRAAEMNLPSLRELAERAARHVVALQQHTQRPAINATGRLRGGPWVGAPLAEPALERIFVLGREFVAGHETEGASGSATAGDAIALLCRTTGAEDALVVHSYAGAVWLALSAIAVDREVIVARAEVGHIEPRLALSDLATSVGTTLREVGTANRAAPADYESVVSPRTAALLKFQPEDYRIVGDTQSAELEQLASLARDREVVLVDALGAAPLVDLPASISLPKRSFRASVAAGADVTIARGDALVGGPECGIIVGRREVVRRIAEHPLCAAWRIDAPTAAGLAATLQLYDAPQPAEQTVPVLQLLATPVDNLRNRAERLAPQLAEADAIAAAEPIATQCAVQAAQVPESGLPSYGIALSAADGDVAALSEQLATAAQPVFGRLDGERLVLDLRFVAPRHDQEIVHALLGDRAEAQPPAVDVGEPVA